MNNDLIFEYDIKVFEHEHMPSAEITLTLTNGMSLVAEVNGKWSPNCDNPFYGSGCDAIKLLEAFGIKLPNDYQIKTYDPYSKYEEMTDDELDRNEDHEPTLDLQPIQYFLSEDAPKIVIDKDPNIIYIHSDYMKDSWYSVYKTIGGKIPRDKFDSLVDIFNTLVSSAVCGDPSDGVMIFEAEFRNISYREVAFDRWSDMMKRIGYTKTDASNILKAINSITELT